MDIQSTINQPFDVQVNDHLKISRDKMGCYAIQVLEKGQWIFWNSSVHATQALMETGLELAKANDEIKKLQAFKTYVHGRLDAALVPKDPEPAANAKHGCRIEGRLNWLIQKFHNYRNYHDDQSNRHGVNYSAG